MVGKPGAESSLRRSASHGDQQISRPENLPGLGRIRTMKHSDKDLANVKLEKPA